MGIKVHCPKCGHFIMDIAGLTVYELSDFVAGRIPISCVECGERIN